MLGPRKRECGREIHSGGRFAHAAFLIHHAEDPSHSVDFHSYRAVFVFATGT